MFGKYFAQTFTGSMFGKGVVNHAVWAYCIANADRNGFIEMNPGLVAATFGDITRKQVEDALAFLCSPDAESRTPDDDGKRLVQTAAFEWRIVNHKKYRDTRNDELRRDLNREAKQRQRERDAEKAKESAESESFETAGQPRQKRKGRPPKEKMPPLSIEHLNGISAAQGVIRREEAESDGAP